MYIYIHIYIYQFTLLLYMLLQLDDSRLLQLDDSRLSTYFGFVKVLVMKTEEKPSSPIII